MPDSSDGRDDEMHNEVDWLVPSDRPIIREVADYGKWIKPASLALNLPYTRKHIADRCRDLADHGLLNRHEETAAYRITPKGREFLDDKLTAENLRENDANDADG